MIKNYVIKDFIKRIKDDKIKFFLAVLFSIVFYTLVIIIINKFGQTIQDSNINTMSIFFEITIMCIGSIGIIYLKNSIILDISNKLVLNIKKEVIVKVQKTPLKYYDTIDETEMSNILISDVNIINKNLSKILIEIINFVVGSIIISFGIIIINFIFGLILLTIFLLTLILITFLFKKVYNSYMSKNKTNSKYLFIYNVNSNIINYLKYILIILVMIFGSYYVINNSIKLEHIIILIVYITLLVRTNIIKMLGLIIETSYSYDNIIKYLNLIEEPNNPTSHISVNDIKGNITFDNISFGYDYKKPIINNVNLKIKVGKKVAIIGLDGSGKTTLIKLMMRLYEVDSGNIYIDKYNIKDISRSELKKIYGVIYQNDVLFNDDNIIYSNELKKKYIKNIEEYVNYINCNYKENVLVREKLINIGQVLVNNPKILVFDAIDNDINDEEELLIEKITNSLLKESTILMISNKLSTVKKADVVIVIENGQIIIEGKHSELIKKNKYYQKFVAENLK